MVAKISNPNDVLGASSFSYTFNVKDAGGKLIATRSGNDFILPFDSKYVAEFGIATDGEALPAKVEFTIKNAKWQKLNDIAKPQIGVYSKNFGANPSGIGNEADGVIRNESGYDLKNISVIIILRSETGDIVGVNKTKKDVVRAKEEQDFRLTWPYQLSGQVQNMEVDPQVNIFDPQNLSV